MSDIERAVLTRLERTLGSDVFLDFVMEFLTDAERLEGLLVEALNAHQERTAKRAAHELRGLAAFFGASALARCCLDIEHTSDSTTMLESVARTKDLCASTFEAVIRILEEGRTNQDAV